MQTVILAGGEGTRLRPLTASTPKPLVPIAGKPAIERLLTLLKKHGIRSATVCAGFCAQTLKEALGTSRCGVRLRWSFEETPLGTAGCVKKAWNGDDVLILSGDSVCEFDLTSILKFHEKNRAAVTIVASEVDDPREYGLITADGDGRINGFLEKPGYDECLTNLANTGAYVISKEIIARIPDGESADFARDVFPLLLKEGKRLFAFSDGGMWHDIGDIPSLLKCQRELLEKEGLDGISEGAILGKSSVASGGTFLEKGAAVGSHSRVIGSLICENACIAENADICEAVVGRGTTAGPGLIMKRFSALGEGCVVGSGVTVGEGARVAPFTKLPDGAIVRTDIQPGGFSSLEFGDGGEAEGISDVRDVLRFGIAAGASLGADAVLIGGSGVFAEALALGVRASGTAVFRLKDASFGESVFCARRLECPYCFFADGGIRLVAAATAELSRVDERKILQAFNRSARVSEKPAPVIDGSAASALYLKGLAQSLPKEPKIKASLRTESEREAGIFAEIMPEGDGERVTFAVASDRRTVTALTEGGVVPYESLLLLCCKAHFSARKSVVLPPSAPLLCDSLAAEYRCSVVRGGTAARGLTMFSIDPLTMICELTAWLERESLSLSAAVTGLPQAVYTRSVIDAPEGLPKLMREGFSGTRAGEDVVLESGGARAYVRPSKNGRAVRMYIESTSQEAAAELSADIVRRIKGV